MIGSIPRVLHFVWIGSDPLPTEIEERFESWRAVHPSWDLRVWREPEPDFRNNALLPLARTHAQRADIIRYDILYKHGGVYLDTDFDPGRPLDDLPLDQLGFFAGREKSGSVCISLMGSAPGHPVLDRCIRQLPYRVLQRPRGMPNEQTGPELLTNVVHELSNIDRLAWGVRIFPRAFFYPYDYTEPWLAREEFPRAFGVHRWSFSWKGQGGIPVDRRSLPVLARQAARSPNELPPHIGRLARGGARRVKRVAYARIRRHLPGLTAVGARHVTVPFGPNELRVRTVDDVFISCPTDDIAVATELALRGSYGDDLTRYARAVLRPGSTVVDVGANLGTFTLPAAQLVGPGGRVLAVECNPRMVEHLQRSIRMNWFDNRVILDSRAASDAAGELKFFLPATQPCLGGVVDNLPPDRDDGLIVTVASTRLDDLVDDRLGSATVIDLLKIDVEGHEASVLIGASRLIDQRRIKRIVLEYRADAARDLSRVTDVISALCDCGALLSEIDHLGAATPIDLLEAATVAHYPSLLVDLQHLAPGSTIVGRAAWGPA